MSGVHLFYAWSAFFAVLLGGWIVFDAIRLWPSMEAVACDEHALKSVVYGWARRTFWVSFSLFALLLFGASLLLHVSGGGRRGAIGLALILLVFVMMEWLDWHWYRWLAAGMLRLWSRHVGQRR